MFEVGNFYQLENGDVGECVKIDDGQWYPVVLMFKYGEIVKRRDYTSDGFYYDTKCAHPLNVCKQVARPDSKLDPKAFAERVATRIMAIIEEEVAKHGGGDK